MAYNPTIGIAATPKISGRQTQTGFQNGTGSSMTVATVVATNTSGQLILADVTNESTIEAMVGLVSVATIPSAANGNVVSDGRLENIPSLGFSVGDVLWLGTTPGTLTNVKPDLAQPGWASGDYVVFIGVVVQNEFNPSNQDIQLCRQIIGQL